MSDILKHRVLSIYTLIMVVTGSIAQPHEGAGSCPFDFINIDGDAHSVGMGGGRMWLFLMVQMAF